MMVFGLLRLSSVRGLQEGQAPTVGTPCTPLLGDSSRICLRRWQGSGRRIKSLEKYKTPRLKFTLALCEGNKHIEENQGTMERPLTWKQRDQFEFQLCVSNCVAQDKHYFWASTSSPVNHPVTLLHSFSTSYNKCITKMSSLVMGHNLKETVYLLQGYSLH